MEFSGSIAAVDDSNNHLGGAVNVGDPYSASIAYDTTVPGFVFFGETLYLEQFGSPFGFNFTATVDGIVFQSQPSYEGLIVVTSQQFQWAEMQPAIPVQVNNSSAFNGNNVIVLNLTEISGMHTEDLPTDLDFAPLEAYTPTFEILFGSSSGDDTLTILGSVTSLTATDPVGPEPSTFILLGATLLAIGGTRAFQARRHSSLRRS